MIYKISAPTAWHDGKEVDPDKYPWHICGIICLRNLEEDSIITRLINKVYLKRNASEKVRVEELERTIRIIDRHSGQPIYILDPAS